MVLVGILLSLWVGTGVADFEEGIRLTANGRIIDIDMGHLVPWVTDWNEDGKKDLIVGQFYSGRIQLFLNTGTDNAPSLMDSGYIHAAGKEIHLPAG